MQAAGTGDAGIVVGFDTEYVELAGRRVIVSYQLATPDPVDPSRMVLVVLLPLSESRVRMFTALRCVWEEARLWRHPLVVDDPAITEQGVHRGTFWDGRDGGNVKKSPEERRWSRLFKHKIPVVLAAHFGKADMTTFRVTKDDPDHITSLTSAAGGLVGLMPFRVRGATDANRSRWFLPFSVSVADTMAHAPAGNRSLDVLGASCGQPKVGLPDGAIERMDRYRRDHLPHFLEYSANDPVVVVEYLARLWGESTRPPVTLSSGAAQAFKASVKEYWGRAMSGYRLVDVARFAQFEENFSGLTKVEKGTVSPDEGRSFYTEKNLEPVDAAARAVLDACAVAYHGGWNACAMPGYYTGTTYDFDLQGAYPTAMSLVPDVDWLHDGGVVAETIEGRDLTLDDIPTAMTSIVADVEFEFPESVSFPTLPIFEDGCPLYVRTSGGRSGTMAMGPEIHLALKVGARVHCRRGYVLHRLALPSGEQSHALRAGVMQMVRDRAEAKRLFGKKSLEELAIKTMANSGYGKTAQDVTGQSAWDAKAQAMGAVGGSAITSPYHAAMTTSFVRAELLAAANQLVDAGFNFYSVTTDGFITDAPEDVVTSLDLYGIAAVAAESRNILSGSRDIWEIKHAQVELLNLTTRGNIGRGHPELPGVLAKNSFKTPKVVIAAGQECEHFWDMVIARTGRVDNPVLRFPSFKELSYAGDMRSRRKDFVTIGGRLEDVFDPDWTEWDTEEVFETVRAGGRRLSMDFDCKRRPVMESMRAEHVLDGDGVAHEVATFTTRPWDTVDECLRGRKVAKNIADTGCLRTVEQWRGWELRYEHGEGRRIGDPHRSILLSILIGHRLGLIGYDVPNLARTRYTVRELLDWLSGWGLGSVKPSDWKNARRPERASQVLPTSACEPFLSIIRACPVGAPSYDITGPVNPDPLRGAA
ncbi:hypothetical protein [Gordonia sp. 852002-51296_SCH5728562-b]|uniref:hypothetical protein n=1 Tax=Gordonia sp. 852002-51296_SCH5728562-b TaxID=1834101 RepID=UPI0007EB60B7|nr:hypothetical protein [Gordonia sp. 852002-51296_SCH5728562-b]